MSAPLDRANTEWREVETGEILRQGFASRAREAPPLIGQPRRRKESREACRESESRPRLHNRRQPERFLGRSQLARRRRWGTWKRSVLASPCRSSAPIESGERGARRRSSGQRAPIARRMVTRTLL